MKEQIILLLKTALKAFKFKRGSTANMPILEDGEIYIDKDKKTIVVGIDNNQTFELSSTVSNNATDTIARNTAGNAQDVANTALSTANNAYSLAFSAGGTNPYGKNYEQILNVTGGSIVTILSSLSINIDNLISIYRLSENILFVVCDTSGNSKIMLYKIDIFKQSVIASVGNLGMINKLEFVSVDTVNNITYLAYLTDTDTKIALINTNTLVKTTINQTGDVSNIGTVLSSYDGKIYRILNNRLYSWYSFRNENVFASYNYDISFGNIYNGGFSNWGDGVRFIIWEKYISGGFTRIRYIFFNTITKTLTNSVNFSTGVVSTVFGEYVSPNNTVYCYQKNTIFQAGFSANNNNYILWSLNLSNNTAAYINLLNVVGAFMGVTLNIGNIGSYFMSYNTRFDFIEMNVFIIDAIYLIRINASTLTIVSCTKLHTTYKDFVYPIKKYDDFIIGYVQLPNSIKNLAIVEL